MTVAVEQANQVAGAEPADRGKLVSLVGRERHRTDRQRGVGVKPFGHPWYNTPPISRRRGFGCHDTRAARAYFAPIRRGNAMSSAKSRSADAPNATRQMLDELDALMERMLA